MVSFLMVSVQQISCYIHLNDLSFVGKKAWSIKYHIRLVSGEAHLNPYSHRHPLGPFLSHLIFGTLVVFKIMKILILYATGAFPSPEILHWEDKGPTINLLFSLFFPPANHCINVLEQKCFFPRHPLFPQGFSQMWYEGVATIRYPETPLLLLDDKHETWLPSQKEGCWAGAAGCLAHVSSEQLWSCPWVCHIF